MDCGALARHISPCRYSGRVPTLQIDEEFRRDVCERYGVASLEVFGSMARRDDRHNSDVDLVHVPKPGVRLGFRLLDLEDELSAVFGRPVDLVARRSINKYLRERVLADDRPHYAA